MYLDTAYSNYDIADKRRQYFVTSPSGPLQLHYTLVTNHIASTQDNSNVFLTPADLRDELGLFSDVSFDPILANYIETATQIVEKYIGIPLINSTEQAYFIYPSERLRLPHASEDVNLNTIILNVTNGNGADRAVNAIANSKFVNDHTDHRHITIKVTDLGIYDDLTTDLVAPIEVNYNADARQDTHDVDQFRQAVRLLVGLFFENRGVGDYPAPPRKIEAILEMLLAGTRRTVVGGA